MVVSEKIKDNSHYCISCCSVFPQQNIKTEVKGAYEINKKNGMRIQPRPMNFKELRSKSRFTESQFSALSESSAFQAQQADRIFVTVTEA